MSIGGHHNPIAKSEIWLTPPYILKALGDFDLDPCAMIDQPWKTAAAHYTVHDDGLSQPWHGRVWLNPPYGRRTAYWMKRLCAHGNGVALIFARTETAMFFESIWDQATALLFFEGRISFHFPSGQRAPANSGAPSVLVAYGKENAIALETSKLDGAIVRL